MLQHRLELPYERLIASGCDQRLIPGADGLNPYGARVLPRRTIALGSCSCSSPSPRATRAARLALEVLRRSSSLDQSIVQLQNSIRATLRHALQLSPEVDIALTPSGTDLEMLAVALASHGEPREIVNIVVGPNEVGSGTCNAAAVRHYDDRTPRGNDVRIGDSVNPTLASLVTVERIDIRDSAGQLLSNYEIDGVVTDAVIKAVSRDARVLVHLVAHSKTGIHAPSLGLIDRLLQTMKEDVVGIVDAAQGRLAPAAYQAALDRGLMVSFTGSKFFGGPPFAGALLVPPSLQPNVTGLRALPAGFDDYFCSRDLPASWFPLRVASDDWFNTGSLLRWIACATEINHYFAIDLTTRETIAHAFSAAVQSGLGNLDNVNLLTPNSHFQADALEGITGVPTVFAFEVRDCKGARLDREALKALHLRLNQTDSGAGFHLGQPVMIGKDRYVLRVALGAPLVTEIATDQTWGDNLDSRLEAFEARLEQLGRQIQRQSAAVRV